MSGGTCRHEWRHGTQECVRHVFGRWFHFLGAPSAPLVLPRQPPPIAAYQMEAGFSARPAAETGCKCLKTWVRKFFSIIGDRRAPEMQKLQGAGRRDPRNLHREPRRGEKPRVSPSPALQEGASGPAGAASSPAGVEENGECLLGGTLPGAAFGLFESAGDDPLAAAKVSQHRFHPLADRLS